MNIGIATSELDTPRMTGPRTCLVNFCQELMKKTTHHRLYFIHRNRYAKNHDFAVDEKSKDINNKHSKYIKQLDAIQYNFITQRLGFLGWGFSKLPIQIARVHGDPNGVCPQLFKAKFSFIHKKIEQLCSKQYTLFLPVSNSVKQNLYGFLGIPWEKIQVIYNGISKRFAPSSNYTETLEKYDIRQPFILHVSNFRRKKNPEMVLFIAKELRDHCQTVIVGARWPTINKNYIRQLNYIPEKDLIDLYSSAEAFVFPSMHETFGVPNLEAMACGCPVVSSNVFSIPEIVGDAGLLFYPWDKQGFVNGIKECMKNRDTWSKKGIQQAKLFSLEICVNQAIRIYDELEEKL